MADNPASRTDPSLAQDPELVNEFVVESLEHLRSIESHVLGLDGGADTDALHAIFRAFHTIKGLAGFLEFGTIQRVAHQVETVLDQVRNGVLSMTPTVVDVVLESADFLRVSMEAVNASVPGPDPQVVLAHVCALDASAEPSATVAPEVVLPTLAAAAPPVSEPPEPEFQPESASAGLTEQRAPRPENSAPAPSANAQSAESRSVKVETSKLDLMVDMVGEMVIAQSMIQHEPELQSGQFPRLARNLAQLGHITGEVQKLVMAMRMVPVDHLFQRMRRVVHDLGRKTGKELELEIAGGDTELDRNLVEELADPLMHMLRNSVDHGIETPAERVAAGKPPAGKLRLAASHGSGHIIIEVSDDGAGLNRERILEKARRNGLISATEELSEDRTWELIFEPGFSTAATVTDVSGRGVGMDVVRRQVQKLRGRVEIHSTEGEGTRFYLKLPLTLAIVDGLVVGVGSERYILPLFAVREILRPAPGAVSTVQDKGEIAMIRGQLFPVVRLYERFAIKPRSKDPSETLLIIAEAANRVYALMVDDLIGKQEVVIKNLGPTLQNIPGVAGGAILGDGRVGLILDLDRIFDPKGATEAKHG